MRRRQYGTRGRPQANREVLDGWAFLLEGALDSANIHRWILERGATPLPAELSESARKHAFEVSVVDEFHRLAQRAFERQHVAAMWERPMHTGKPGRPEAIDIALFDESTATETRMEFGIYSRKKLRDDCEKLARLSSTTLDGYPTVDNFLLLWHEYKDMPNSTPRLRVEAREFADAAAAITSLSVTHVLTSSVDLFGADQNKSHVAFIGVFQVEQPPSAIEGKVD